MASAKGLIFNTFDKSTRHAKGNSLFVVGGIAYSGPGATHYCQPYRQYNLGKHYQYSNQGKGDRIQ
jgi:hypothetical protein